MSTIITNETPIIFPTKVNRNKAVTLDGKSMFYKKFDVVEFIGEHLAEKYGVRSAKYFPISFISQEEFEFLPLEKRILYTGSIDFNSDDINYKRARSMKFYYREDNFDVLLSKCLDNENRFEFFDDNLDMFALDIYMGQLDRVDNTLYGFTRDGKVVLSPCFDYEISLKSGNVDSAVYESDFFRFMKYSDYDKFIKLHPEFKGKLERYLDVNLVSEIEEMADERKFSLDGIDMQRFREFDEQSHKRLVKILN